MFGVFRGREARALLIGASALLLARGASDAATVIYRTDTELIRAADRIVRGRVISVRVEESPNGAIHTITTLAILEDFSGHAAASIEISELGGSTGSRFLHVDGAATYQPGSEVVVMLERTRGGRFRSLSMGMSKFDVLPSPDGDPVLVRSLAGISVTPGGPPVERIVRLSRIRGIARTVRQVPPVLHADPVADDVVASDSFTLLRFGNGLGGRWIEADSGIPVRWYRDVSAPAPLDTAGDGAAEIQTALSAWSSPSDTSLRLTYNGGTDQQPYGPWSALGGSGAGVIFFEDPNDEIAGNVLAIGGGGGTANDGGTVNGTTFNRLTHGFVIMQNAAALGANFRQPRDFSRVMQHEIGHAIGLGHTPTDGTVPTPEANIMYPSCCGSLTPIAPALGPDDHAGLVFIYPAASACTYAVTPGSVQLPSQGGSFSLTVSTGAGCAWHVQPLPAWITGTAGARTGPGSVTLAASANTDTQSRSATLDVAGHFVPVSQSGSPGFTGGRSDFNGDGRADLLWHHRGYGGVSIWFMNGTTLMDGQLIAQVDDTGWSLAGSGDLDGDGHADFVWQHTDGRVSAWLMNGLTLRSGALFSIPSVADTHWEIRSVGDLDGDGRADLFWQHQGDGRLLVWLMDGLTVRQETPLNPPQVPDTSWQLVATADFDGDGKRDLLWHHVIDGWIAVWRMNGLDQIAGGPTMPGQVPDVSWRIRAAADLNGDGHTDIVWQNVSDGRISAWLMRGLHLIDGLLLTPSQVADLDWRIVGPR